jgi:chromosome partitioning protein
MNAMVLDDASCEQQDRDRMATPLMLAVMHPKGGVGRSTTVWHLGAELALRGRRVVIEDLDQARHLSAVSGQYPLGLDLLQLGADGSLADLVILDTAPEADHPRAIGYVRRAD